MWLLRGSKTVLPRQSTRRRCRPLYDLLEDRIDPATFYVADVTGLQAAITTVNFHQTEQATIFLEQGTYALKTELQVVGASNLTIKGDASGKVIIDGGNVTRDFKIDGGNVTLFGLTVTGGNADFPFEGGRGGGGILFEFGTTLNVDHCNFTNNHADFTTAGGGAIAAFASGTLNVDHSDFTGNHADGSDNGGGAITDNTEFQSAGTLNVDHSDFTGNHANGVVGGGGAIAALFNGTLNVDHSDFTGNHADDSVGYGGGAILTLSESKVNVAHSNITGNSAAHSFRGGGGMLIDDQFGDGLAQAEIDFSTISGNTVDDLVFAENGSAHLKQTVVGTTLFKDTTLP